MKNYSLFIVFTLLLLAACKPDEEAITADTGFNYVRTTPGDYVIYEVDSIVYDDFNGDTTHYRYQLKEVIESVFSDNEGRPAQRIERYVKRYNDTIPYSNLPWTLARVWSAQRTATTYERVEENVRYLRLSLPLRQDKRWNGNTFNTLGEWQYKCTSADAPYSINNLNFDSTAFIVQKADTNRLYYKLYTERYARNTGLIEKQVVDVFDTALAPTSVLSRIAGGLVYKARVVEWGHQ
jgi:hypothetical protein